MARSYVHLKDFQEEILRKAYEKAYEKGAWFVTDDWICRLFKTLGNGTSEQMKNEWDLWIRETKRESCSLRLGQCYGAGGFMLVRSDTASEWLKAG